MIKFKYVEHKSPITDGQRKKIRNFDNPTEFIISQQIWAFLPSNFRQVNSNIIIDWFYHFKSQIHSFWPVLTFAKSTEEISSNKMCSRMVFFPEQAMSWIPFFFFLKSLDFLFLLCQQKWSNFLDFWQPFNPLMVNFEFLSH